MQDARENGQVSVSGYLDATGILLLCEELNSNDYDNRSRSNACRAVYSAIEEDQGKWHAERGNRCWKLLSPRRWRVDGSISTEFQRDSPFGLSVLSTLLEMGYEDLAIPWYEGVIRCGGGSEREEEHPGVKRGRGLIRCCKKGAAEKKGDG